MKNLSIEYVVMRPYAGSVLADCIREAANLAFTENRIVIFNHNQYEYQVNPADFIKHVEATRK